MDEDAFTVVDRSSPWCFEPEEETDQGYNQAPPSVATRPGQPLERARREDSASPCAPCEHPICFQEARDGTDL